MSEEIVNEIENEEVAVDSEAPVFDKANAIKESKDFIADLLLKDPQTQQELFVATNVQMNEDGSISIVCVDDIESDKAVMHTIFSGYVDKAAPDDTGVKPMEESDIITPSSGLVGLDGQPLT